MKTKSFIFIFFFCSLIFITIVAIEPSKDGTQFGAIEFKSKAHTWRPWGGGWVKKGGNVKGGAGSKIGGAQGSSGSTSGGNAGEGGAQGGGEQIESEEEKESGVDGEGGKLENNKEVGGIYAIGEVGLSV
ncbi:hypothetical protein P8452_17234 [Trifolium repens]|nr:hypothetical protein P8452_17234 [Trifolium repens]